MRALTPISSSVVKEVLSSRNEVLAREGIDTTALGSTEIISLTGRNEVLAREGIDTKNDERSNSRRYQYRRNEVLAREGIDTNYFHVFDIVKAFRRNEVLAREGIDTLQSSSFVIVLM